MTKTEIKKAFEGHLKGNYIDAMHETDPNIAEAIRSKTLDRYWDLCTAAQLLKVNLDPLDVIWLQAKREYQAYLDSKTA